MLKENGMHYGNYRKASHFLYSLLNKKNIKIKKIKKNKIKYIINKKQLKKKKKREKKQTFYCF